MTVPNLLLVDQNFKVSLMFLRITLAVHHPL